MEYLMKTLLKRGFVALPLLLSLGVTTLSYAGNSSSEPPPTKTAHPGQAPINVIFDTNFLSDIDYALALAMLHALQDRHEINLVAVTVSTDIEWCASYVDLIDTFYGHAKVPIGPVRDGLDLEAFRAKHPDITWPATRYTEILSEEKKHNGSL